MISCNEWNISIFLPFINISNVLICLQRKFWITKIRHACHISTSRLGSKGILDNISSKLYKNMLNRRYYWHLLSCETFCKTGITKYSLKNFFPSLTDLTNLPTCTNPGASSNGWFHWSAKTFAFRGNRCVAAFSKNETEIARTIPINKITFASRNDRLVTTAFQISTWLDCRGHF